MTHKLIELASVDGAGKTSVGQMLAERIGANYYYSPPECLREIREQVRGLGPEANLAYYMLGNHIASNDIGDILAIKSVVAEPYTLSTQANHTLKLKREIIIPESIIQPDQIIYLTAEWDEIERRLAERGEARKAHENVHYLMRVAEQYNRLLEGRDDAIRVNTTGREVEETVGIILEQLKNS